jgi:hypothetical protein
MVSCKVLVAVSSSLAKFPTGTGKVLAEFLAGHKLKQKLGSSARIGHHQILVH